jgi:diadenosine tetraphosphate (Ap4A) HIT family hydrolase
MERPRSDHEGSFQPPGHLMILQTEHWTINHRVDSALPGYLMLASRMHTNDLEAMPRGALQQLGLLLASAQRALTEILMPQHLYIGRYGHSAGLALHFHVIPICAWVKQGFLADPRYRVLQTLSNPAEAHREETDGAELTLYVWREFCESATPPAIQGLSIREVVERLRTRLSARFS